MIALPESSKSSLVSVICFCKTTAKTDFFFFFFRTESEDASLALELENLAQHIVIFKVKYMLL